MATNVSQLDQSASQSILGRIFNETKTFVKENPVSAVNIIALVYFAGYYFELIGTKSSFSSSTDAMICCAAVFAVNLYGGLSSVYNYLGKPADLQGRVTNLK